jgi:hypothetical protein
MTGTAAARGFCGGSPTLVFRSGASESLARVALEREQHKLRQSLIRRKPRARSRVRFRPHHPAADRPSTMDTCTAGVRVSQDQACDLPAH